MRFSAILCAVSAASLSQAVLYNLQSDWSDTSNPNGVWSYRNSSGLLNSGLWTGDVFTTPQQAWNGSFPQTMFRNNGTGPAFDWVSGDIISHNGGGAPTIVRFTAPFTGTFTATGSTWQVRAIGRSVDWAFRLNSVLLTSGTMASGATTRATPMNFTSGTGGAAALTNVSISAGDILELSYNATPGSSAEYAGINLGINLVPEPATIAALALGVGILARRRRKLSG